MTKLIIPADLPLNQKRSIAGRLGGLRNVKNNGKRHMRRIAKLGAHRMWSENRLEPVLLNDFAIVRRSTGEIIALQSGRSVEDFDLPAFEPDPEFINVPF